MDKSSIIIDLWLSKNYLAKSAILDNYLPPELINLCDKYLTYSNIINIQFIKQDMCSVM